MSRLDLEAPSRLHFGLLGWGPKAPRQFGGVGLMVDRPGLSLSATPSDRWLADGSLSARVLRFADRIAGRGEAEGLTFPPLRFEVQRAPAEHVGLGSGTQLGLSVARLMLASIGIDDPPVERLADLSGRGLRSGIGLHGFAHGGLIVDGGRRGPQGIPPLLARVDFPRDWSVLLVVPPVPPGLHGPGEVDAFRRLPPLPDSVTDRLCRLVLLGLLPAVAERDLDAFGSALEDIQRLVGQAFAPEQGGLFARPELESLARSMKSLGLVGVGQSSWGPTLYGFSHEPADCRAKIADQLGLPPGSCFWTAASLRGASLRRVDRPERDDS